MASRNISYCRIQEGRKKKLCFIIPSLETGGAEKNLVAVVNNIATSKYQVYIICLTAKGSFLDRINAKDITLINLNHPSIYLSIFKILPVIRKINPDCLISWMGFLNSYLIFFKPFFSYKLKWVCRESSLPSFQNKNFRFRWLFNILYRFYNRFDVIICQSKSMSSDLIMNFGILPDKIKIIPNPSCIESSLPFNRKITTTRKLLFVGRFSDEKRVELLIETLKELPESYSLVMVGSGYLLNSLKNLISESGLRKRITIVEHTNNVALYYNNADCLLLCSKYEGFPNVVIESLSVGCPAIGMNIQGGGEEVFDNYGGFYIHELNIRKYVSKIIEVCEYIELDKEYMIKQVQEKYNLDRIISEYENVFDSILKI